jgi:glycosyltransferase involved in cell wall biosynthesis
MYLTIWLDRLNKRDKLCLTISEQVTRELEGDYGVKSISVPVGVDMEHFSNRRLAKEARRSVGIDEQSTVGLFSGRWDVAHKGLDVLVTIMRERRDIHWLVCTDRDVAVDGVKNLTVLRNVAYAEMPAVYCAADFSIQLSRYESFGLAFLESVACRVPVISTPVGVTNQVYADPPLSELVVANPSACREKTIREVNTVIEALKNRGYRDGLAARGRAVVEREFSLDMWKARMRDVLQRVVEERECE